MSIRHLKRARRTLKFLRDYFELQAACAKANIISPGREWKDVYQDVSEMVVKWTDDALKESQKKRKRKKP